LMCGVERLDEQAGKRQIAGGIFVEPFDDGAARHQDSLAGLKILDVGQTVAFTLIGREHRDDADAAPFGDAKDRGRSGQAHGVASPVSSSSSTCSGSSDGSGGPPQTGQELDSIPSNVVAQALQIRAEGTWTTRTWPS